MPYANRAQRRQYAQRYWREQRLSINISRRTYATLKQLAQAHMLSIPKLIEYFIAEEEKRHD